MNRISRNLCNKSELIEKLAKQHDLPQEVITVALDTIFEEITSSLVKGNRVEIRGLGSFEIRKYKGYKGRNPQNKELIEIPPKTLPFFKTGIFKNELNKK